MNHKFLVGLGIVTSLAVSGTRNCVWAQETPQSEIAADALQVREIAVKNLPVRMMAWMLDAAHNAEPISIQQSRANVRAFGDSSLIPTQPAWKTLPLGVKSVIVASDAQNSILAVGSKAGIQTVVEAVEKFDKPLRQIEIEVQAVQLNAAEVKNLGLQFSALDGAINKGRTLPITLARTPDGEALQLKVRALIAQNKAKVLNAPHVTAINGLTASLNSQELHPFLMNFDKSGRFPRPLLNQRGKSPEAIFYVTMATGLTVTPTINDNRTVTLDLMPAKTLRLGTSAIFQPVAADPANQATNKFFNPYAEPTSMTSVSRGDAAPVGILEGFRYQLTVADNETVVFGGVSSALYAKNEDKAQPSARVILLVRTRVLPLFEGDPAPVN